MTTILILFLSLVMLLFAATRMKKFARKKGKANETRRIELLHDARIMFPTAENDIEKLDLLYQHKYREMILAKKADKPWAQIFNDCIHIWTERNEQIRHAVEFESRYLYFTEPPRIPQGTN